MGAPLKQNPEPNDKSYRANLHAANLGTLGNDSEKPERTNISGNTIFPSDPLGGDADINQRRLRPPDLETTDDNDDDKSDFQKGYESSTDSDSIAKKIGLSILTGGFSPPGTGVPFFVVTSMIRLIFGEETSTNTNTNEDETEET